METNIHLKIDTTILLSLKRDSVEFSKDLLYCTALVLYRKNKLSLGKASELAGFSRMDFVHKLQIEGETIFDYDLTYLEETSESLNRIKQKMKDNI